MGRGWHRDRCQKKEQKAKRKRKKRVHGNAAKKGTEQLIWSEQNKEESKNDPWSAHELHDEEMNEGIGLEGGKEEGREGSERANGHAQQGRHLSSLTCTGTGEIIKQREDSARASVVAAITVAGAASANDVAAAASRTQRCCCLCRWW
jgi:hypothetical protein